MKNTKNIFIILFGVVFLLICLCLYLFVFNKNEISSYKDSVVKIIAYDEEYNEISSGSGVSAISKNIILTNAHVIKDAKSIEILTNQKELLEVEGIQYVDEDSDIAIIKLSKEHNLSLLKTSSKVSEGDSVYAIGYSLGILNAISDGIISSKENMDTYGEVYSHTAPISGGNSGGALLNSKGQLIGINFASYDAGQNMNLAIKISKFEEAYNESKNDESIKFDVLSLSSTQYFSSNNGKKLLGEISATTFDYLVYGIDEITDISNFANHNYTVTGISSDSDGNVKKVLNLGIFNLNKVNDDLFDVFKTYVKEKINYANYNIKGITLDYYWNCDNDYCYIMEYYKMSNSQNIIGFLNNNIKADNAKYEEHNSTTVISNEKIIQESAAAIPAYTESVTRGQSISNITKDRIEVGEDLKPGKYNIKLIGSYDYVYAGAVEFKMKDSSMGVYLDPSEKDSCYYDEQQCDFLSNGDYFNGIKNVVFEEGDIIHISYPTYSSQTQSLQFTAIPEDIEHEEEPAKEQIVAKEIMANEAIKKNTNGTYCYINNNLVNRCEVLFDYDNLVEQFN